MSTKARLVDFGEMEQGKRKIGGILNSALVWFWWGRGGERVLILVDSSVFSPNPPFWDVFFPHQIGGKNAGERGA